MNSAQNTTTAMSGKYINSSTFLSAVNMPLIRHIIQVFAKTAILRGFVDWLICDDMPKTELAKGVDNMNNTIAKSDMHGLFMSTRQSAAEKAKIIAKIMGSTRDRCGLSLLVLC